MEVHNGMDILDSRDVDERIEELEDDDELLEDETDELEALKTLQEEGQGYCCDWKHGATLIRDSYFKEYAEELAGDIGAIDPSAGWPLSCIDWEQAATELQIDYSSIDFDGIDYWIR